MTATASREIELAKFLVEELGGQSAASRKIGLRQPSVWRWTVSGIPPLRETDLRFRFPRLECWKRFPPLTQAKA